MALLVCSRFRRMDWVSPVQFTPRDQNLVLKVLKTHFWSDRSAKKNKKQWKEINTN